MIDRKNLPGEGIEPSPPASRAERDTSTPPGQGSPLPSSPMNASPCITLLWLYVGLGAVKNFDLTG